MKTPDKPNLSEVSITDGEDHARAFQHKHGLDRKLNIVIYRLSRLVGDKHLFLDVAFSRQDMRQRSYVAYSLCEARKKLRIAVEKERKRQENI